MHHPLVRLAALIDWAEVERAFAVLFTSGRRRPALPSRLIAGLLYLQHTSDASDEAQVNILVENPYWQYFCGETYLQTELPIWSSSLTCWRKRVGEEAVETLLAASVDASRRGGVIKQASTQQVIVDTSVMPQAIDIPPTVRCWRQAACI
jgi:IS5 family transposase